MLLMELSGRGRLPPGNSGTWVASYRQQGEQYSISKDQSASAKVLWWVNLEDVGDPKARVGYNCYVSRT